MKKRYSILLFIGVLLLCAIVFSDLIALKLFGLKEIEAFSEKDYSEFVYRMKEIEGGEASYLISTKEQFRTYYSLVTSETQYVLTKPIQILYFEEDKLVSFHSSCNVPLNYWTWKYNWNFENRFEQYPPKTSDSSISVSLEQLQTVYPVFKKKRAPYTIVVFWTRIMEKQVLEVVEVITKQKLLHLSDIDKYQIVFINTDQSFIGKVSFDDE